MPDWHVVIPFFFGKNMFVHPKGGAPPEKKIEYLQKTTDSIVKVLPAAAIRIFVCDESSEAAAKTLPFQVQTLHCPPQELPHKTLCEAAKLDLPGDDILFFTEDDQILQLADTVREDIKRCNEDLVFSPHRWSQTLFGLRRRKRPRLKLNGRNGVLDNIGIRSPAPATRRFNHTYDVQDTQGGAYAACWAMRFSTFRKLKLDLRNAPKYWLEVASFLVFDQLPVLKLSLRSGENPASFIVNHLSGYDFNKRIF